MCAGSAGAIAAAAITVVIAWMAVITHFYNWISSIRGLLHLRTM
jgi:hypothetical protein